MQERFRPDKAYPDAYKAMLALSQAVEKTGLSPQLTDLVNYRVSQLNGCAFCLDMHSKDLRARGETEQRLYMISAWRPASLQARAIHPRAVGNVHLSRSATNSDIPIK